MRQPGSLVPAALFAGMVVAGCGDAAPSGNAPGEGDVDAAVQPLGGRAASGAGGSGSGGSRAGGSGGRGGGGAPAPRSGAGGSDEPRPGGTGGPTGGMPAAGSNAEPSLDCTHVWSSGFETGFPGEWLDYDEGYYSADGSIPGGRNSAWMIVSRDSGEPVHSGDHAYKGWIVAPDSASQRPYPVIHVDFPTPMVNTWMVYLEADYDALDETEWIHVGTWGTAEQWALHTMSVRNRILNFAHTEPFGGEYIGPEPRDDFPRGRWVRLTMYLHYEGSTGTVQVWQDGVALLRAEVAMLADHPTMRLERAHWGMYAAPSVGEAVQYNDDIGLWTLSAPLDDLEAEPDCYLAR